MIKSGVYKKFSRKLAREIKEGAVGVIPTDTIYGIVGSALDPKAVLRIYRLRKRDGRKPLIVLISSTKDLKLFGAKPDKKVSGVLKKIWPGKVSVLFPVPGGRFFHVHRGRKRIAFRLPADEVLRNFLKASGPLVAPSANLNGRPPAENVREARRYFGDNVDFYVDKGTLKSRPSTLIGFENGRLEVLRKGAVNVDKLGIL
jgi:L-threonylcarbamoyladenylate synthase